MKIVVTAYRKHLSSCQMYKKIVELRGISSDFEDVSWSQIACHKFRKEDLFVLAVIILHK